MGRFMVIVGCLAGILLSGAWLVRENLPWLRGLFSAGIEAPCMEALRQRLAHPSSLKLTRSEATTARLTREELIAYHTAESGPYGIMTPELAALELEMFDLDTKEGRTAGPIRFGFLMVVEAENALGMAIRSGHDCHYIGSNIPTGESASFFVKLDGLTRTDWLAEQAKALQ